MTLLWFSAGYALADLLGVYLPWSLWRLPAAALAAAVWFLLRHRERGGALRPAALGLAVSLLWLTGYGAAFHAPAVELANRTVRLEAVATGWPERTDYGVRVPVKAGETGERKVRALFYGEEDLLSLRPGDRLESVAYCTPADRVRGEESLYYTAKGILLRAKGYGEATVTAWERFPLRYAPVYGARLLEERIDRLYPEKQAGLLRALLAGDRSGLTEIDRHNFSRAGLGHAVVISGLHVSFLVGLLSLFLKPGRKGTFAAMTALLVLFCLMTGSAPGTVRAVVLCAFALLAREVGREYSALTGLAAALLLLLAWNPWAGADAGLQFSFLSTLGILVFGQRWASAWTERVPRRARTWVRPLAGVAAVSLSAMLFTVPLSALYFRQVSLAAPLSNLLAGWAVAASFAGGLLSVLGSVVLFPLGQALAAAVSLPVRFFFWIAGRMSRLPLAALTLDSVYYRLWLCFVYLLLILWLFLPGKGKRPVLPACAGAAALCLAVLLTAGSAQRQDLMVTALDVGQGQSVAICAGRSAVLVDCGGSLSPGDAAAGWFQSMGRRSLDLLVLTHFDEDHACGVPELMGRIRVRAAAVPDVDRDSPLRQEIEEEAARQGIPVYYVTKESAVSLDRAELTLMPPVQEEGENNELCLSVLFSAGDWDGLITGDMSMEGEALLLSRYDLPDLEMLVAGHHGSRYATGEALLKKLAPETVLISVGYNSYGHPAPETLERLERAGASVYRTDQLGNVTVYARPKEAT